MRLLLDFIQWLIVVTISIVVTIHSFNFIINSYTSCTDVHEYVEASIINVILIILLAIVWLTTNKILK